MTGPATTSSRRPRRGPNPRPLFPVPFSPSTLSLLSASYTVPYTHNRAEDTHRRDIVTPLWLRFPVTLIPLAGPDRFLPVLPAPPPSTGAFFRPRAPFPIPEGGRLSLATGWEPAIFSRPGNPPRRDRLSKEAFFARRYAMMGQRSKSQNTK